MMATVKRRAQYHATVRPGARRTPGVRPASGFVLPLVLMILLLLGLLGASFALEMQADVAATRAVAYRLQTRAAAEAGIQVVTLMLRDRRLDVDAWYDNREELHRVLLWQEGEETTAFGKPPTADAEDVPAYRFSIVADDPADDEIGVRYGVTNEAAKLNINQASVQQLRTLIAQVVPPEVAVEELADALVDWRDADDQPGESGAEREYYMSLEPPYMPKNGPFDTVEELLMVKGFTAQILYGEDYDRNGLLTFNEDDGDETFPIDDADGTLNRGLYPYITVWSRDFNTANDAKPRVYVGAGATNLQEELADYFEPQEIAFIEQVAATLQSDDKSGNDDGDKTPAKGEETDQDSTGGDSAGKGSGNETAGEPKAKGDDEAAETGDGGSPQEQTQGGETEDTEFASLVALLHPVVIGGSIVPSPFELEDFPRILDRLTLDPRPEFAGVIDVNTAPAEVLRCVTGMTETLIADIISQREMLDSEAKQTPAWILTEQLTDDETMELLLHNITARGFQFTIESLGYADHIGTVSRLQVVVEMRGPVAQTIYYRDLTPLGFGYPIRLKDEEEGGRSRAARPE